MEASHIWGSITDHKIRLATSKLLHNPVCRGQLGDIALAKPDYRERERDRKINVAEVWTMPIPGSELLQEAGP